MSLEKESQDFSCGSFFFGSSIMIELLQNLPSVAWITILILGIFILLLVTGSVIGIFYLMLKKNIKTKVFELSAVPEQQKELLQAEGKDQLDNQCQVAKQMLKELRIKMFTTGKNIFSMQDSHELVIMELISYRITDRLNYDVRNDLIRNHITKKTDEDLYEYSLAKAKGYYFMIKDRLFIFNDKLPEYDLPQIIEKIPINEINSIFLEIYKSAKSIAGGGMKHDNK